MDDLTLKIIAAAAIALIALIIVLTDKKSRFPRKAIKSEGVFNLKTDKISSGKVKVKFAVICELADKDYDLNKLAGLANLALESILAKKPARDITKRNINGICKESAKMFLSFEGMHNRPTKEILSARYKVISLDIIGREKLV